MDSDTVYIEDDKKPVLTYFKILSHDLPIGNEEGHKTLSEDSCPLGRHLNQGFFKYKVLDQTIQYWR